VPGSWQASAPLQMTGSDPSQTPDWQTSVWVHPLASSQADPSGLAVAAEQFPVEGLQVPAT
jgi:hypothetical protein